MNKFEILCTTMNQNDFSKIKEMNVHSNIVFANQCNETSFKEIQFENSIAKMLSTNTKGVGINRNLALMFATADICLFGDDDIYYYDNLEYKILKEFEKFPDADIIIFNLDSNSELRKQKKYSKSRRWHCWQRMPWGSPRIAFKLSSIKKKGSMFNLLFGGGCLYPFGEDSIWLMEAKREKLKFYISNETIGKLNFDNSSWFSGRDEKYYFGKGAYYAYMHPRMFYLWIHYYAIRTKSNSLLSYNERIKWMINGKKSFTNLISYEEFNKKRIEN